MLTMLVVALSLAAPAAAIDVPFLPQTDALCGGAATAMVFRYWGDAHADVQEFAPLVDRRAGGILNDALVDAVRRRGWRAGRIEGSVDSLRAHLANGQPVIVLVPDRGNRFHYVVALGANDEHVVVHDPSWGPSRTIARADFERSWRAAGYWSLVILPPESGVKQSNETATAAETPSRPRTACDEKLDRSLGEIRVQGLERADSLLDAVRVACPADSGPLRELSGVRFAQRRWQDAASLARDALALEPHDAYALDVLGSSLFILGDSIGALRAWNQIDKPRVNLVRIDGVRRTRHQTIAEALGLRPNMLLGAESFERARRRLSELPDQSTARLAVRPENDGFATVDVVVAERALMPRGAVEWIGAGIHAGVNREIAVAVPGRGGQGDVWSARWSWWAQRPGVSVGFAAPRPRGLPGVWRVDGSWQEETYASDRSSSTSSFVRQSRTRGALTMSDWLTGGLRYEIGVGLDAWDGRQKTASIGGSIERRAFGDRLAVSADAAWWTPVTSGPAFDSAGAHLAARSSTESSGLVHQVVFGATRVSDAAPFAIWPGASDGHARASLLRAHPLLDDGVVDAGGQSAFGRTLLNAGFESQRWLDRPSLVRVGIAGFVDAARASRRAVSGTESFQVDVGAGLRIKIPGSPGVLRLDIAHGARDGANALTVGWLLSPLAK
jgi:hypothetical protein